MNIAELFTLLFILFVFGGASGVFTYVSTRLLLTRLAEEGVFVRIHEEK